MRVIVTGLGKCGTTGMASMIADGLKLDYVHEPKGAGSFANLWKMKQGVVKINIYYIKDKLFDSFDGKILIHRDPRDRFISGLLFNCVAFTKGHRPRIEQAVQILRQKEADPKSMGIVDLYNKIHNPPVNEFSPQQAVKLYSDLIEFGKKHPTYLQYKYEDWIDNKLGPLEAHLGKSLAGASRKVNPRFNKVVRTKSYDNWRRWFTPADVEYFKPIFEPYMKYAGYDFADWNLSPKPIIKPDECSAYVRRIT